MTNPDRSTAVNKITIPGLILSRLATLYRDTRIIHKALYLDCKNTCHASLITASEALSPDAGTLHTAFIRSAMLSNYTAGPLAVSTNLNLYTMKQLLISIFISICWLNLNAQNKNLPIIDMHLHANEEIYMNTLMCFPQPCEGPGNLIKDISELLPLTVEEMNKYNIVLGVLTEANLDELYRWQKYDHRFKLGA